MLPDETPTLGGNWLSLISVHVGGVLLWASIFVVDYQSQLYGSAYVLWLIALVPIVIELWGILRKGIARMEQASDRLAAGTNEAIG